MGVTLNKKEYINWYCRENNIDLETLDNQEQKNLYKEYLHNVGR